MNTTTSSAAPVELDDEQAIELVLEFIIANPYVWCRFHTRRNGAALLQRLHETARVMGLTVKTTHFGVNMSIRYEGISADVRDMIAPGIYYNNLIRVY